VPVNVSIDNSDDPGFIEPLNRIVEQVVTSYAPQQVWLIRIDNWFDHKWLKFSGQGKSASDIPLEGWETVKTEFYRDRVTFPPFTPSRVINQYSYGRSGDDYAEVALPFLPHQAERRHTNDNLQRRIQSFADSASFVWFSSNTVANGRGSVMIYNIGAESVECWFASFEREQFSWKLKSTKGVSRRYVETLLNAKIV
jgi:hypothetical protein